MVEVTSITNKVALINSLFPKSLKIVICASPNVLWNHLCLFISLVFESGTLDIYNTQINYANHISEKTLDLLLIGKPFIMCSKLIYEFFKLLNLNTYEDIFEINYNEVFKDNSFNQQLIIDLLIKINNMNDLEYKEFLSKLNNKAIENKNIIKKASEENTFYTDMLALNHFKN